LYAFSALYQEVSEKEQASRKNPSPAYDIFPLTEHAVTKQALNMPRLVTLFFPARLLAKEPLK